MSGGSAPNRASILFGRFGGTAGLLGAKLILNEVPEPDEAEGTAKRRIILEYRPPSSYLDSTSWSCPRG